MSWLCVQSVLVVCVYMMDDAQGRRPYHRGDITVCGDLVERVRRTREDEVKFDKI